MIFPPFRSKAVLAHARGQRCTFRFPECCDGGGETTVACHIRDRHKGMGQKASDHSIGFGCGPCHRELDEHLGRYSEATILFHEKRALQETWEILIADEIIKFPHDPPPKPKPTKPRKPKEKRQTIKSAPFPKGGPKRKIQNSKGFGR